MDIVKADMKEAQLQIGSGRVKPSRFLKLARKRVIAKYLQYMAKLPTDGLNHGRRRKNKKAVDKDNSKVTKKIKKHLRGRKTKKSTTIQQSSSESSQSDTDIEPSKLNRDAEADVPEKNNRKSKPMKPTKPPIESELNVEAKANVVNCTTASETKSSIESELNRDAEATIQKSNPDEPVDVTSVQHAQEMWNKSKKKNKNTYFDKKNIQKDLTSESNAVESWAKKNPPKKGAFWKKRGPITSQTVQEMTTTTIKCSKTFENGLYKDVSKYLNVDLSHNFVVAKRRNMLLPPNHIKAAGIITNSDFKSLQIGTPSVDVMNYICDYLIKPSHLNLTIFADEILKGKVPFQFSINDKNCFLPSIKNEYWELLIFNTKKSINYNISTSPDKFSLQSKMERFSEFINSYNESSTKQRLRPFQHWKEYTIPEIEAVFPLDSAISILYYVYKMSNETIPENLDVGKMREIFLQEILQYSEDLSDCCLICGQENDSSKSESITWTSCATCERWLHDTCINHTIGEHFECAVCKLD